MVIPLGATGFRRWTLFQKLLAFYGYVCITVSWSGRFWLLEESVVASYALYAKSKMSQ